MRFRKAIISPYQTSYGERGDGTFENFGIHYQCSIQVSEKHDSNFDLHFQILGWCLAWEVCELLANHSIDSTFGMCYSCWGDAGDLNAKDTRSHTIMMNLKGPARGISWVVPFNMVCLLPYPLAVFVSWLYSEVSFLGKLSAFTPTRYLCAADHSLCITPM